MQRFDDEGEGALGNSHQTRKAHTGKVRRKPGVSKHCQCPNNRNRDVPSQPCHPPVFTFLKEMERLWEGLFPGLFFQPVRTGCGVEKEREGGEWAGWRQRVGCEGKWSLIFPGLRAAWGRAGAERRGVWAGLDRDVSTGMLLSQAGAALGDLQGSFPAPLLSGFTQWDCGELGQLAGRQSLGSLPGNIPCRVRLQPCGTYGPGEAKGEANGVAEGGVGAGRAVRHTEGVGAQHGRDGTAVGAGWLRGHAGLVVLEAHAEEGLAVTLLQCRTHAWPTPATAAPTAAVAVAQEPLLVHELLQLQLKDPGAPNLRGGRQKHEPSACRAQAPSLLRLGDKPLPKLPWVWHPHPLGADLAAKQCPCPPPPIPLTLCPSVLHPHPLGDDLSAKRYPCPHPPPFASLSAIPIPLDPTWQQSNAHSPPTTLCRSVRLPHPLRSD